MPMPVWAGISTPTTSGYNNKPFFCFLVKLLRCLFPQKNNNSFKEKKTVQVSILSRKISAEKASRSSVCAASVPARAAVHHQIHFSPEKETLYN